ncbi:ABC transporter substrate-binding protein [Glutamicibacter sp. NPDC087344]|uniref:ABC transporter substrate-binding protein n=1 Tax=Glutamicibacter sp. NPDC087344 TaxID=3363994 RepID=UPI0038269E50
MKITARARFAAAALSLSLLATGCASGTNASSETAAAAEASQNADGTITVDTAFGQVSIPADPQRVVALEGGTVPAVEAGLTPLATAGDAFDDSFGDVKDYDAVADLPSILTPDGWDYEQLVELKPDLLIGFVRGGNDASEELSSEKKAEFEKLDAIAPTVLIRTNGSAGTRDASVTMAEVLGNGEEALAEKKAYEDKVAQVKADYADQLSGNTFAAIDAYEDVTVYSKISWIGKVLDDLGAPAASVVKDEAAENGVFLSFEQLSQLDDATVIFYPEYTDGASDALDTLEGQATWSALPAVKDKHAFGLTHFFPDNYGAALRVVEQIEEALKGL